MGNRSQKLLSSFDIDLDWETDGQSKADRGHENQEITDRKNEKLIKGRRGMQVQRERMSERKIKNGHIDLTLLSCLSAELGYP